MFSISIFVEYRAISIILRGRFRLRMFDVVSSVVATHKTCMISQSITHFHSCFLFLFTCFLFYSLLISSILFSSILFDSFPFALHHFVVLIHSYFSCALRSNTSSTSKVFLQKKGGWPVWHYSGGNRKKPRGSCCNPPRH